MRIMPRIRGGSNVGGLRGTLFVPMRPGGLRVFFAAWSGPSRREGRALEALLSRERDGAGSQPSPALDAALPSRLPRSVRWPSGSSFEDGAFGQERFADATLIGSNY